MVVRSFRASGFVVADPGFPGCGCAGFDLVEEGARLVVEKEFVGDVCSAVVAEDGEEDGCV